MKCFECDKTVQIKKYRAYMYRGIGLDNLCLLNQRVEVCKSCDTETALLRSIGKLHRSIGVAVALQPTTLTGPDMRYLRRSIGFKTGEIATQLSVSDETYSRYENGKNSITRNSDKVLRLIYLTELEGRHPDEYTSHAAQVVKMEINEGQPSVIAIDVDDLNKPARYLPETHEIFEEPEASIVRGEFLTFEKSSLSIKKGVASLAAPHIFPGELNVCNTVEFTA